MIDPTVHAKKIKECLQDIQKLCDFFYPEVTGWTTTINYWEDGDFAIEHKHGDKNGIVSFHIHHSEGIYCKFYQSPEDATVIIPTKITRIGPREAISLENFKTFIEGNPT